MLPISFEFYPPKTDDQLPTANGRLKQCHDAAIRAFDYSGSNTFFPVTPRYFGGFGARHVGIGWLEFYSQAIATQMEQT